MHLIIEYIYRCYYQIESKNGYKEEQVLARTGRTGAKQEEKQEEEQEQEQE
jgi:hypothetical protein